MLSKPHNGWVTITIESFQTEASYLVDIPFDWLRACMNGLKFNIPISLFIEEEVRCSYINSYYYITHIIIEDDEGSTTLQSHQKTDFLDITFMLINDINRYYEDWVKWYSFENSEKDFKRRRKELRQLIDKTEELLYIAAKKLNKPYAKF